MEVKNDLGLLEPLYKALARDSYTSGGADITPTTWLDSPRIAQLKKAHKDEIEESVSKRAFSALGNGFHNVMETSVSDEVITEERIFWKHPDGLLTSGAIDARIPKGDGTWIIVDYKVTSAHGTMYGIKPAWKQQLNSYAYLLKKASNIEVSELYVLAMLRDWKSAEAGRPGYPAAPIMQIPIPLWSFEDAQAYVDERISLHQEAAYFALIGEELPLCTAEEMWERQEKFAVMKSASHKRASRLLDTMEDAINWAADPINGLNDKNFIQHRPGKRVRCEDWCEVASFCSQHKAYLESSNGNF